MKRFITFMTLGLICFSACEVVTEHASNEKRSDYINPLIGTDVWQTDVAVAGHEDPSGYTFPGVTEPSGMTEWTAHTIANKEKNTLHHRVPYRYEHNYISGFLGTHYPSGAVMFDYGAVEIMPTVGTLQTSSQARSSSFKHANEISKAYYYEVFLDDYAVKAQLAARKSSSIMNFTFPESDHSHVIIDAMPSHYTAGAPAFISINPEAKEVVGKSAMTARGYRETGYFVVQFDKDFSEYGTFNLNDQYPEVIETQYLLTEKDGVLVPGLKGIYTQGDKKEERIDPIIDFDWDWYMPADDFDFYYFNVKWVGKVKAPVSGVYKIGVQADDGVRLYIDNKLVISDWQKQKFSRVPKQIEIELEKDKLYDIKVEYFQDKGASKVKLSWVRPDIASSQPVLKQNKNLALSTQIGAYINFKTTEGEVIKAKVGTSFISVEQARKNLQREIPHWDLAIVKNQTAELWDDELAKITLKGATKAQKETFYTALYHSLLLPRNISENGQYRSPYDGKVYAGNSYTDYSIWDTFRATHPLLNILDPKKSGEMIQGLLNAYSEGGWLPKWPNPGYTNTMLGSHADSIIADAYIKGIRNFDIEKAQEAMLKNAYEEGNYIAWGRKGIEDYIKLGYVPTDKYTESVARTMEFAYDDFCIANFLTAKGETNLAEAFFKRSKNFLNVLDKETKLVRGKNSDGTWRDAGDYSISLWTGSTEKGTYNYKKNYTLFAPHDVSELVSFLGGKQALSIFLDEIFDNDIYYVGDEFSMHAPYLYNYSATPWKTQERSFDIVNNYYLATPGGLPGNDDAGQLSSWYLFSAMGFYPVCPGCDSYQIGIPSLPDITINLDNGNTFHIATKNFDGKNKYIQSITLNGKPHRNTTLKHQDIMQGGKIEFELGLTPNKKWFVENGQSVTQ